MKNLRVLFYSLTLVVVLTACDAEDNYPGSEYMPDMVHSVAMESNVYSYYYYNTWNEESVLTLSELTYPRANVKGTVPRGFAGKYLSGGMAPPDESTKPGQLQSYTLDAYNEHGISVPTNGYVPYYYEDSPEGRQAAMEGLQENPFPITKEGLERGGNLYNIYCGICHGAEGNGLGYIYDDEQNPNAKYPLAPANLVNDQFSAASNGRIYHAIIYGYNAMGPYKDKLSYEERWQVIHYIRALQAKANGKEYSDEINSFNEIFGTPVARYDPRARSVQDDEHAIDADVTFDVDPAEVGKAGDAHHD